MKELINSYHQQKSIPVFNRRAHERILRDQVIGYEDDRIPALKRFAHEQGYTVLIEDMEFRFAFYPKADTDDCAKWPKIDVPVEHF